jgi:hypothetical protein
MPSMAHEVLVDLFRNRPEMAAELLVEVLGAEVPAYTEARLVSVDLTEARPAEYSADAVVLHLRDGEPVLLVVVEVQLARDDDKPFTWPSYIANGRRRHRCPVSLLVVAPNPKVADWCARPIELGPPGFVLHPAVLRREGIPLVADPAEAARRVELGVLSAMAHGQSDEGLSVAKALLPAIDALDEERARFYYDLVYNSLNEAARRALEEMMKGYEYQSDFAKKYVAQGRAEANAQAVLTALRVRSIAVTDEERARILAEKDLPTLERWIERSILAASVAEVLAEPSRAA